MRVLIEKDYDSMSRRAAQFVADLVRTKPNAVLGLATGTTPIGLYKELIRMHKEERLDFSKVTTFNLDEYYGLPPTHEQSYYYFMHDQLFNHINIPEEQIHVPSGLAKNVIEFCQYYEDKIKQAGGIDLQVLGIGGDGHIGFNEPGSSLGSRTRFKTLAEETISDNARLFFNDKTQEVPKFCITMGVGTVMEAKRCLLMASGPRKAKVLSDAIEGPVTCMVSASALQLHPDTVVIVDEECSSGLNRGSYYKHVEKMTGELENIQLRDRGL
jgi:glucosamine-6-phosphate deaminase